MMPAWFSPYKTKQKAFTKWTSDGNKTQKKNIETLKTAILHYSVYQLFFRHT